MTTNAPDTVTVTLSVEDLNALISAGSSKLAQLDQAIENGEHVSLSFKHLDEQRRAALYGALRCLRHGAWEATQK